MDNAAMVSVITDGLENASREYSGRAIKALVERMKNEEGWNFAFMGTNQDVEATSASLAIDNYMAFRNPASVNVENICLPEDFWMELV